MPKMWVPAPSPSMRPSPVKNARQAAVVMVAVFANATDFGFHGRVWRVPNSAFLTVEACGIRIKRTDQVPVKVIHFQTTTWRSPGAPGS